MDQLTPIKKEFVRIIKELKKQHGISYTEMHRQTGIKHDLFKKASAGQSFAITGEQVEKLKMTFAKELKLYPSSLEANTFILQDPAVDTMAGIAQKMQESIRYELDEGQAISLKLEQYAGHWMFPMDRPLQAWLKSAVCFYLQDQLAATHTVIMGQQGLLLNASTIRIVDIAVYSKHQFEFRSFKQLPEIVIEIDCKAYLKGPGATLAYFQKKNEQLKANGVKKIIWIFTDSRTVWIINDQGEQQTIAWSSDLLILENVSINIQNLLDEFVGR